MMEIIINKNTNLEKEKLIVKSLEQDLKEDLKNINLKSLKYHSMAFKKHKKVLEKLEEQEVNLECQLIN